MGREFKGVVRTTFLIDPNGKIVKIWDNVKIKDHAIEVLEALKKYLEIKKAPIKGPISFNYLYY